MGDNFDGPLFNHSLKNWSPNHIFQMVRKILDQDPKGIYWIIDVTLPQDTYIFFEAKVKNFEEKELEKTLNSEEYFEWTVCLILMGVTLVNLQTQSRDVVYRAYDIYKKVVTTHKEFEAVILACLAIYESSNKNDEQMHSYIKDLKALYPDNTQESFYYLGTLMHFLSKHARLEECWLEDAEQYLSIASILNPRLYECDYRMVQHDLVYFYVKNNNFGEARVLLEEMRRSNMAYQLMPKVESSLNLLCMTSRTLIGDGSSAIYEFIRKNVNKFRVDRNPHLLPSAESLVLQFCHEQFSWTTLQDALDRYAEVFPRNPNKTLLSKSKFLSMILHGFKQFPFTEKQTLMLSVDILRSYNYLLSEEHPNVDYNDNHLAQLSVRRYTESLFYCVAKLQETKVPVSFLTSLVFKFIENMEIIVERRLGKKNGDNSNYYGDIAHAYRLLIQLDPDNILVPEWQRMMESNRKTGEDLMFAQGIGAF